MKDMPKIARRWLNGWQLMNYVNGLAILAFRHIPAMLEFKSTLSSLEQKVDQF